MTLARLILLACPAVLASVMFVAKPVHAVSLTQITQAKHQQVFEHRVAIASIQVSSDPQLPKGCTCARCSQAAELLQGKFPQI